jgi:hypothetical protein
LLSSYPFGVEYRVGDLVMLAHSIEYLGEIVNKGEVAIVIKLYDKSYKSCEIYDCRISLADGGKLIKLDKYLPTSYIINITQRHWRTQ